MTRSILLSALAFAVSARALAAVVLQVDINAASAPVADTAPGFSVYTLTDETLNVGSYSVDISPASGADLGEIHRTTPATTDSLTLGGVYRDGVLASDNNTANFYRVGIDTVIRGLTPEARYTLTAWSYDSGSAGVRMSDWSILGLGGPQWVANNYSFDGTITPASDQVNRFTVTAYADAAGALVLRGRPATPSTSSSVFLNGFTLESSHGAAAAMTSVLAVDFNDRSASGAANTHSGFVEFTLNGTDASGATSNVVSRAFGTQAVSVTPVGGTMD
ncbi:MAG: hypothetical protein EOP84_23660, partial [Verrucomicrobiaceae bacterium]